MEEEVVLEEMIETTKLMVRDKNLVQISQIMTISRGKFQDEITTMPQN